MEAKDTYPHLSQTLSVQWAVGSVDFGGLSLFRNSEATLSVLNILQLILGSGQVEAKDTQPHLH